MEASSNQNVEPFSLRAKKDAEMLHKIDAALAEETTLLEGLQWGVDHGMLTPEQADEAMILFWKGPEPPTAA